MKKPITQSLFKPFRFLFAAACRDYSHIFKGGIVLLGVTLAGLSQVFPVLLEHGEIAMQMRFELEEKYNEDIELIDCDGLPTEKAKCKLAKWKRNGVIRYSKLSDGFFAFSSLLGLMMILFSILGWAGNSISNRNSKN